MEFLFCPLTGNQIFEGEGKMLPQTDGTFTYEYVLVGKARLATSIYLEFTNKRDFKHFDLAGICRNAFEEGKEPTLIDREFIEYGIKNYPLPNNIKDKGRHLLKYMYQRGGNDFTDFEFASPKDFTIAFASSEGEFNKIIKNLEDRELIHIDANIGMSGYTVIYKGVILTEKGLIEVEKELANIPLIGLVNEEITTGDDAIDKIINHAKRVFFEQPQSFEKMRSACESLSYILEPLRKECETFFGQKDVNVFFEIVNNFDIRHNKDTTKRIQYPEQLEWVFYSLLNTINTYTKLKKRKSDE